MPSTTDAPPVDLDAVKSRQQATWASGDYSLVATRIASIAEALVDIADLRAGWRVLDVATGSGNAAIAAARLGCQVTGLDYVPSLLERGRERAAAERLDIEFVEGDAEALPFADASFDAVVSVVGVMFAPDHARAAAELARVCRPGGRIALASWTPSSFVGAMFATVARHVPPPAGLASPMLWGSQDHLDELLGREVDWTTSEARTYSFRFRSPGDYVDFFRTHYGPTHKAFGALDEAEAAELERELSELAASRDRLAEEGAIAIPGEYLVSVGVRR